MVSTLLTPLPVSCSTPLRSITLSSAVFDKTGTAYPHVVLVVVVVVGGGGSVIVIAICSF